MDSRIDLSATNPLRPADWRYRLALERVAAGLAFPRTLWDYQTLATAIYLDRLRRGEDRRRLAAAFPDLHLAIAIYHDQDREYRWALEAQLLAGDALSIVAAKFGVAETVVSSFESVCFDVSDRLDNADFIIPTVVGPQPHEPYEFHNSGWKLLAYLGGPGMLSFNPVKDSGIGGLVGAHFSTVKFAVSAWMRWRIENGGDCDPRLLRNLARIVRCLDDGTDENDPINRRSENVKQFFRELRISDERQKLIEKHPDFAGNDKMRATVKSLEAMGLWGRDWEESEPTQPTPGSHPDDPAATAVE
jgi:hypothetical protein